MDIERVRDIFSNVAAEKRTEYAWEIAYNLPLALNIWIDFPPLRSVAASNPISLPFVSWPVSPVLPQPSTLPGAGLSI